MAIVKKTETKAAAAKEALKPAAAVETKAAKTEPEKALAEAQKAEPVKAAEPKKEAEPKKAEEQKKAEPVKKTAQAKKSVAVKKEAAPKKEIVKKEAVEKEPGVKAFVQYAEKEVSIQDLTEAVKKAYGELGRKTEDIKSIEIYVKPEEGVAYYVINNEGSPEFKVSL